MPWACARFCSQEGPVLEIISCSHQLAIVNSFILEIVLLSKFNGTMGHVISRGNGCNVHNPIPCCPIHIEHSQCPGAQNSRGPRRHGSSAGLSENQVSLWHPGLSRRGADSSERPRFQSEPELSSVAEKREQQKHMSN